MGAESSHGGSISSLGKLEPGGHVLHRLPDGTEQRWHILEWSFDPFTPKSASVTAFAEKASTMDSESDSEARDKKRRKEKKKREKEKSSESESEERGHKK